MIVDSATDAEGLVASVAHFLGPALVAADVVIMDNQRAHKMAGSRMHIEACGTPLIYLSPHSPPEVLDRFWPTAPKMSELRVTIFYKARTCRCR
jgi:hypothetical protein